MKKFLLSVLVLLTAFLSFVAHAGLEYFTVRPVTNAEFYSFVKVFSEMRGPLRAEIMKDRNTNFENADPLKYVSKVKDEKDVKNVLKDNNLSWKQFSELTGNILLGYFSIQPEKTKAALIKQLSGYGLMMADDQIPAEYRQVVQDVLRTDEGASLAGMALEYVVQIPPPNVELARKNEKQLDQLFYTRFWRDELPR